MKFVYLIGAIVASSLAVTAQAQTYFTASDLSLEVSEAVSAPRLLVYPEQGQMVVRQSTKLQYDLRIGARTMPLSEKRFALLATLFSARTGFHSAAQLNQILSEDQSTESTFESLDWATEIAELNAQIQSSFGKALILTQPEDSTPVYKIAAAMNGPAAPGNDEEISLGESGTSVRIWGHNFNFSVRENELIQALFKAPGRELQVAQVAVLMGLPAKSKMPLTHVKSVNNTYYRATGRRLIEKIGSNTLVLLKQRERLRAPDERASVKIEGQLFENLSVLDRQLIRHLDLAKADPNYGVILPVEFTEMLDASPRRIEKSLDSLNKIAIEKLGRPLVDSLTFTYPYVSRNVWTPDRGFRWYDDADAPKLNCEVDLSSH